MEIITVTKTNLKDIFDVIINYRQAVPRKTGKGIKIQPIEHNEDKAS